MFFRFVEQHCVVGVEDGGWLLLLLFRFLIYERLHAIEKVIIDSDSQHLPLIRVYLLGA